MADNFSFDLLGVSLERALDIAMNSSHPRMVEGWQIMDAAEERPWKRLVLFWHAAGIRAGDGPHGQLPAALDAAGAVILVQSWLDGVSYGPKPDIDGDVEKGCRVYNEAWGHVAGNHYAFVAIEPVWLLYGK